VRQNPSAMWTSAPASTNAFTSEYIPRLHATRKGESPNLLVGLGLSPAWRRAVRRDAPPPPPPDEQALSTFHVDKTRHCYSPTRHDCQQKRAGTARACVPPPCWASGAARNSRGQQISAMGASRAAGADKIQFFLAAGLASRGLHASDAVE